MQNENEGGDVVPTLAAMIADEIGDRLYHDDSQVGQVIDWQQTTDHTVEFQFADGRTVLVTVSMGGRS